MHKIWLRESAKNPQYFVQIGKRQIPLGPDKAKAEKKYHALMLDPTDPDPRVSDLAEEFLEWLQNNREARTKEYYEPYLSAFIDEIGRTRKVSKIKPFTLSNWADREFSKSKKSGKRLSDSTRNAAYRSVIRMFNWAKKSGLIRFNPVDGVEKPAPIPCEDFITPEQYAILLSHIKDRPFRDIVVTLWECGMRPQELRALEARHYDADRNVWILDRKQSKGKRSKRIIYLTPNVKEIHEQLAKRNPTGKLFRGRYNKPLTKEAIKCRFQRIAKKVNFPCHAYLLRHGFATDMLTKGVDSVTVAGLMGHSSTKMLETVYQKATRNDDFMHGALSVGRPAEAPQPPSPA